MKRKCLVIGLIYMKISPSGGKYIGQTNRTEEERWREHVKVAYNSSYKDYNDIICKAIRKYGSDNFDTVILEDNIPSELLNEREMYWIDKENTYYRDSNTGYNMTRGGNGRVWIDKDEIKEIDKYIIEGHTLKDASELFGYCYSTISHHTNVPREVIKENKVRVAIGKSSKQRLIGISKYDTDGNFIDRYKNKYDAAESLCENPNVRSIMHCCRGERLTLYNYIFVKDDENQLDEVKRRVAEIQESKERNTQRVNIVRKVRPIVQYTLSNEYVNEYESLNEAERQTNTNSGSISRCCKNKQRTANNFIWKYKEE